MWTKTESSLQYLTEKTGNFRPDTGIILGTGLGGLTRHMNIIHELRYRDIPGFPDSTVEGHEGTLLTGTLGGRRVVVMKGRFHFYEGYSMEEVVFPIRVLARWGIQLLIASNAAGGMDPEHRVGDIMLIEDHINLLPNPLTGPNDNRFGPRFPDMSKVYEPELIELMLGFARDMNIRAHRGVYLATSGPTFETPAEYRYFRTIGADAVGMSTVPEIIAAHHMGVKNLAVSVITDLGVPGRIEHITHEAVQKAASKTENKLSQTLIKLLEWIG